MEHAEKFLDELQGLEYITQEAQRLPSNSIAQGRLCGYCARLEWKPLIKLGAVRFNQRYTYLAKEAYKHQPTLRDLQASAKDCVLCSMIEHEVLQDYASRTRQISQVQILTEEMIRNRGALPIESFSSKDVAIDIEHRSRIFLWTEAKGKAQEPNNMSCLYIILPDWLKTDLTRSRQAFDSYSEWHESQKKVKFDSAQLPRLNVCTFKGDPFENLGVSSMTIVDQSQPDDSAFGMMSAWIQDCIRNHLNCSKSLRSSSNPRESSQALPTRLVHIIGDEPNITLRLHEPKGEKGKYVALSYCWGKNISSAATTTKDTLGKHKTNIDRRNLPKTYIDAITVTRKVGQRFLWIDSLCIVQDSLSDWETEASKMGEYYGNALATLCADGAEGGDVGFLTRQPGPFDPVIICQALDDNTKGHLLLNRPIYGYGGKDATRHYTSLWYANVEQCPLATRAWAMQERILSPRKLHFGKEQVFWECAQAIHAEGGDAYTFDPDALLPSGLSIQQLCRMQTTGAVGIKEWYGLVEGYTARNLTRATDRLVAISGLAKRFHRFIGHDYLAGLWDHDLHVGLAWWINTDVPVHRPVSNTVPSWSWASIEGHITAGGLDTCSAEGSRTAITVLSTSVDVAGPDPFGRVSGGRLKLRGQLQRVRFKSAAPRTMFAMQSVPKSYINGSSADAVGDYYDDCQLLRDGEVLFALRLSVAPLIPGPSIPAPQGILVLKPVDDTNSCFERVGAGSAWYEDWFQGCEETTFTII